MDTNELLYQAEMASQHSKAPYDYQKGKRRPVRSEQVEMNIHTLLFINKQRGPLINTA